MDATWVVLTAWLYVHSDVPVPPDDRIAPVGVQEALREIALRNDWARGQDHPVDIAELRQRRASAYGAPPSYLFRHLPPLDYRQEVAFAQGHLAWLEGQYHATAPGLRPAIQEWIEATKTRIAGYQALAEAERLHRSDSVAYMRAALGEAARFLGEECLWTGVLPPAVPVEFFRRIP